MTESVSVGAASLRDEATLAAPPAPPVAAPTAREPAVVRRVVFVLDRLVSGLFIAILLLVNFQIFCRFVMSWSVPWTEEISRLMFVYLAYLGASLAFRDHAMITIDTLPVMLKEKGTWLKPIVAACSLAVIAFLFLASIPIVSSVWSTTLPTVDWISNGWAYLAFTISFGLMLLHALAVCIAWAFRLRGAK